MGKIYDFTKFASDAVPTYYEDRDRNKKLDNVNVQRVFRELKVEGLGKYKGWVPAQYKVLYPSLSLAERKELARLVDLA